MEVLIEGKTLDIEIENLELSMNDHWENIKNGPCFITTNYAVESKLRFINLSNGGDGEFMNPKQQIKKYLPVPNNKLIVEITWSEKK